MRTRVKTIITNLRIILFVSFASIAVSCFQLFEVGNNEIIQEERNQNGMRKAVLFMKEGNATKAASLQVSVLNRRDTFGIKDVGNIFAADDDHGRAIMDKRSVRLAWISTDTLLILYDQKLRTVLVLDSIGQVRVYHQTFARMYPDDTASIGYFIDSLVKTVPLIGPVSFDDFRNIPPDAISQLVELIDYPAQGDVGFPDPFSSRFPRPFLWNCTGIRAAYAIEYMIAGSVPANDLRHGLIVKLRNGEAVYERLSLDDMRAIKRAYKKWWDKNSHLTLDELKLQRSSNGSPLPAGYIWY